VAYPKNVHNGVTCQNNIFYTKGQLPATFINGVINICDPGAMHDTLQNTMQANATNLDQSPYNTSVGEGNRNAYTPQEIIAFVKAK
jgi:hypothetical protein